jgi:hypothetical protein
MLEPNLVPTLSMDCVGHGISNYRPLVGIFLKWLYLPIIFKRAKQIEIRIRHFDHRVLPEGAFLRRERVLEPRVPGELQPQYLGIGILLAIHSIHSLTFPSLAEHPTEDFAGVKTLKIILDTAIADGLHWAATEISLQSISLVLRKGGWWV